MMTITFQTLSDKLKKATNKPIRLVDLFPNECDTEGRLHLNKILIYCLGPTLSGLQFSNCVISDCDFSHINIKDCDFTNCIFGEGNIFTDINVGADIKGFPVAPPLEKTEVSSLFGKMNTEVTENWETKQKRQANWFRKMWLEQPEYLFCYEELNGYINLLKSYPEQNFIIYNKLFYEFNYPRKEQTNDGSKLRWKLHLSVNPDNPENVEQAFNLAAPIISRIVIILK